MASTGNPDAESDTLVTISSSDITDKIKDARVLFRDPFVAEHLYWCTAGSTGGFSIIGFAGEFKKDGDNDSNKNQVIMALATAQLQRKALELKDSIIMGAISSWGRVQIFSSYWESANSVSVCSQLCISCQKTQPFFSSFASTRTSNCLICPTLLS